MTTGTLAPEDAAAMMFTQSFQPEPTAATAATAATTASSVASVNTGTALVQYAVMMKQIPVHI